MPAIVCISPTCHALCHATDCPAAFPATCTVSGFTATMPGVTPSMPHRSDCAMRDRSSRNGMLHPENRYYLVPHTLRSGPPSVCSPGAAHPWFAARDSPDEPHWGQTRLGLSDLRQLQSNLRGPTIRTQQNEQSVTPPPSAFLASREGSRKCHGANRLGAGMG
mmetsp:Transcript_101322/g.174990  ORF Transcript_101322/g.174990 Transcript_101322/m.174990 type:complete len:163 (+) Transcript_101322:125-613(+)